MIQLSNMQEQFASWRLFVGKNRREVLIGITTVLLSSQAMLLSQLTQKKEHELSRELSITLLFELSKLLISSSMFFINYNNDSNQALSNFSIRESILYALPAIIYLINDNLIFTIISLLEVPYNRVLGILNICFRRIPQHLKFWQIFGFSQQALYSSWYSTGNFTGCNGLLSCCSA